MKGLTGKIILDNEGFRSDFLLDIVELTEDGVFRVGTWNISKGIDTSTSEKSNSQEYSLQNTHFTVMTTLVSL